MAWQNIGELTVSSRARPTMITFSRLPEYWYQRALFCLNPQAILPPSAFGATRKYVEQ